MSHHHAARIGRLRAPRSMADRSNWHVYDNATSRKHHRASGDWKSRSVLRGAKVVCVTSASWCRYRPLNQELTLRDIKIYNCKSGMDDLAF